MTDEDPRIHLSGTGKVFGARHNEDGTLFLLLVTDSTGSYQQVSLNAKPHMKHELDIHDGERNVMNIRGEIVVKAPKRFRLVLEGELTEDLQGNLVNIETVRSPYGKGKDQCGNSTEGTQPS